MITVYFKFRVQWKQKNIQLAITRYLDKAHTRYHSRGSESAPAEGPSHTIAHPGGTEQGQANPTNISSKVTPKNKATSKAEYTNTQQGLPITGYNLVRLTRHARLFGLRGLFCRKSD